MKMSIPVKVELADLKNQAQTDAVRMLLSEYMADPMGGAIRPHSLCTFERMIADLLRMPTAMVLIAYCNKNPVGMAVCFTGYSTFKAAPLVNIHDIIVTKNYRGKGIGKLLLKAVEEFAKTSGCCKITLEVRQDNMAAQMLYKKYGFTKGEVGMDFLMKNI